MQRKQNILVCNCSNKYEVLKYIFFHNKVRWGPGAVQMISATHSIGKEVGIIGEGSTVFIQKLEKHSSHVVD